MLANSKVRGCYPLEHRELLRVPGEGEGRDIVRFAFLGDLSGSRLQDGLEGRETGGGKTREAAGDLEGGTDLPARPLSPALCVPADRGRARFLTQPWIAGPWNLWILWNLVFSCRGAQEPPGEAGSAGLRVGGGGIEE